MPVPAPTPPETAEPFAVPARLDARAPLGVPVCAGGTAALAALASRRGPTPSPGGPAPSPGGPVSSPGGPARSPDGPAPSLGGRFLRPSDHAGPAAPLPGAVAQEPAESGRRCLVRPRPDGDLLGAGVRPGGDLLGVGVRPGGDLLGVTACGGDTGGLARGSLICPGTREGGRQRRQSRSRNDRGWPRALARARHPPGQRRWPLGPGRVLR